MRINCTAVHIVIIIFLHAACIAASGLRLLDVLFSKDEMVGRLLVKSKRSEKPVLDKTRVDLMFSLIDKRFGTNWNTGILAGKCNQKCRDAQNYFDTSESEHDGDISDYQ